MAKRGAQNGAGLARGAADQRPARMRLNDAGSFGGGGVEPALE